LAAVEDATTCPVSRRLIPVVTPARAVHELAAEVAAERRRARAEHRQNDTLNVRPRRRAR